MIVKYEGNRVEKQNNEEGKMYIFKILQKAMDDDQKLFSHIIVDGNEIYEDFEQYVDYNIDNIIEIEIVTFTLKEYVNNMFKTLDQYIEKATPLLNQMIERAYSGEEDISFNSMIDLGESIQWMNQLEVNLNKFNLDSIDVDEFTKSIHHLNESLPEMVDAMESNDQLIIADLLNYEVLPAIKDIQKIIQDYLEQEQLN